MCIVISPSVVIVMKDFEYSTSGLWRRLCVCISHVKQKSETEIGTFIAVTTTSDTGL